ncbi:MAG: hypothetical protein IKU07_07630 [Oscillospiraceae bacterium]|nr:hypothetical protein [Oscillospiraceae bacterium]
MKRLISILLLAAILLCGCSGKKSDEEILAERRDIAEAHMRYMMSVLWESDVDISYSRESGSMGPEQDEAGGGVVLHLKAGTLYAGMPYTHGGGGAESFLSFGTPDENGVYQMSGLTTQLLNGGSGSKNSFNTARLSNDCADAVYWAWSRVGTSFTFSVTNNMTAERGCLPVGDYKTESNTYTGTRELVKENGDEVMLAAYALLQKADAVVTSNNAGHAMMIARNNPVKNGDAIDPEASYVLVHEQFTTNYRDGLTYTDEKTGRTVYQLGGVDRKYTYAQLLKKGYLPITIKELVDPAEPEYMDIQDSVKEHSVDTITTGSISTMMKIDMVTVTITDEKGEIVQEATVFTTEKTHIMFRMELFEDRLEAQVTRGSLDIDALAPGKYHCKTTCSLGTGETATVRDFDFTVS